MKISGILIASTSWFVCCSIAARTSACFMYLFDKDTENIMVHFAS